MARRTCRRWCRAAVREQSRRSPKPRAVERIVRKHVALASNICPTLKGKRVTPHVLRHSAAMQLLQNGVDHTVIALWLGHESVESTQMYVHADIQIKDQAMAKTQPVAVSPGRYRPNDELLAFLEGL
jgi:integrase/recombinase XerD